MHDAHDAEYVDEEAGDTVPDMGAGSGIGGGRAAGPEVIAPRRDSVLNRAIDAHCDEPAEVTGFQALFNKPKVESVAVRESQQAAESAEL